MARTYTNEMMQKSFSKLSSFALPLVMNVAVVVLVSGCHSMPKHHKASITPAERQRGRVFRSEIQNELADLEASPTRPPVTFVPPQIPSRLSNSEMPAAPTALSQILPAMMSIAKLAREPATGALSAVPDQPAPVAHAEPLKKLKVLESSGLELSKSSETPFIFDIPVTYNDRVRTWIKYFQREGRVTFKNWLERSSRYLPVVQYELSRAGLPRDLAWVAMVESGFSPSATSPAGAKGMWQFIPETGRRYGLQIDWWLDERKDFHKATKAAIHYMTDLYGQFNSWYLVTASYNMGENGVRRLIRRHHTTNFWQLAEIGALPQETCEYLPKIIAAMLISKAPALYGFRDLDYQMPLSFESIVVPGGTDIVNLATYLGVSGKYLKDLNPELIRGLIPDGVQRHRIRVPKGSMLAVSQFIRMQARVDRNPSPESTVTMTTTDN